MWWSGLVATAAAVGGLLGAAQPAAGGVVPPLCPPAVDTPAEGHLCMLYQLMLGRSPENGALAY
jgi:hypothetical protein